MIFVENAPSSCTLPSACRYVGSKSLWNWKFCDEVQEDSYVLLPYLTLYIKYKSSSQPLSSGHSYIFSYLLVSSFLNESPFLVQFIVDTHLNGENISFFLWQFKIQWLQWGFHSLFQGRAALSMQMDVPAFAVITSCLHKQHHIFLLQESCSSCAVTFPAPCRPAVSFYSSCRQTSHSASWVGRWGSKMDWAKL